MATPSIRRHRHLRDEQFANDWISMFQERPTTSTNTYQVHDIDIEGILPVSLQGTFFRNGPGTFNRTKTSASVDGDGMLCRLTITGGKVFFHNRIIDTVGYLEEQKRGPLYRGPFGSVPDDWLLRGMFSPQLFKNTANTSQLLLNRTQMLCFWEGGLPTMVDPTSLRVTTGECRFDRILEEGRAFSAHPVLSGNTMINFGINYGQNTTLTVWEIDLARRTAEDEQDTLNKDNSPRRPESSNFNSSNKDDTEPPANTTSKQQSAQHSTTAPNESRHRLLQTHGVRLRSLGASIHDCSITKNWIIVAHDPVSFNYFKLLTGYSIDDWLGDDTSQDARTHVYLFPRHGSTNHIPSRVGSTQNKPQNKKNKKCYCLYKIPASFSHHHVQAFEDVNGNIILDRIAYSTRPPLLMESILEKSSLGNAGGPGQLQRTFLPKPTVWGTQNVEVLKKVNISILKCSPISCEMPIVNTSYSKSVGSASLKQPKSCNFVYSVDTCSSFGPWTGINKSNISEQTCTTWRPKQTRTFVGEPIFAPKSTSHEENEDEGWLLCLGFHAAEKRSSLYVLNAKTMTEVCRIRLLSFIPFSHHCLWTSEVFLFDHNNNTDVIKRAYRGSTHGSQSKSKL